MLDSRVWEQDRALSIKVYACLAAGMLAEAYFGLFATTVLSPAGAQSSLLAFVVELLCLVLVARYKAPRLAGHIHVLTVLTVLSALTLVDRDNCAMLMWFIPLGPLLASFLLDLRSIAIYSLLSCAPIILGFLNGNFERSFLEDRTTDADWIIVRLMVTLMVSTIGAILGYSSGRGIRDLIAQSRQIKQEVHDSASNQRTKSAFLAQMSHEIRTPVHGIMGMIVHLKSISATPSVLALIDNMQECAENLAKLLTSILDLAKIESGKIDLKYTKVELREFVESIASEFEPYAREQGLTLVANTPEQPCWVWIDAGRTRQAIAPLIENAIKFSSRGQIEVDLALLPGEAGAGEGQAFEVVVRDQGVGLSDAQQSSIFEHFEQFHDEFVKEKGGIGLGLTLVSRLVASLGGEVQVHSEAGEGSEFVLRLVGGLQGPPSMQDEAQAEIRRQMPMSTWGAGKDVLLGALEQEDKAAYRRRRLLLFHRVFTPALVYYLIEAVAKEKAEMAGVLTATLAYILGSMCWMPKRGDYLGRSRQFVWAYCICIFAMGVCDGMVESDTLWLIALGPIIAAFLNGLESAIRYMGLSFGLIVVTVPFKDAWFVPIYAPDTSTDSLIFRLVYLSLFAAVAIGASWVHRKQERSLTERHIEWLALREKTLAANAAKTKFLATMSHEIRTPMNGVLGLAQDLLAQDLRTAQNQALETIHRCGGHLLVLLNEILDSSRVESDEIVISKIPFDAGQLLEDVLRLFESRAKLQGLELKMKGPARGSCRVLGDPTRVVQILANLVGNAIKFSDSGVVELELQVEPGTSKRANLTFVCRDQGLGMSPEQLVRAFEDYVQIDEKGDNQRGGTGLGLPISRKIARCMEGELWATSELGVGSAFSLALSLERDFSTPSSSDRQAGPAGGKLQLAAKVLVVDDNPINRKVAALQLERMGCEVGLANHGKEALKAVQDAHFDLVLMDVRMPVLDGIEATERIRALGGRWLHLPIIALTADGFEETRQACLDAGMNDHLAKPFQAQDLRNIVVRHAASPALNVAA